MTSETFLAERQTGIGGSDIASLFNFGYGCTRRLAYDKLGAEPDFPDEETPAVMEIGTALEPVFRRQYERKTGNTVYLEEKAERHLAHRELIVHVDGLIGSPHHTVFNPALGTVFDYGVLEIKSVGAGMFARTKRLGLPEDYALQLQHGMLCTDSTWGAFQVGNRDTGESMHWEQVRDETICEAILEEGPKFWANVLRWRDGATDLPARLEPDDDRCQKCRYRRQCQGSALIELDPKTELEPAEELRPLFSEYLKRKNLWAEASELLEETKEELKTALGARTAVSVAGHKIYYREQVAMKTDTKMLADRYEKLRAIVERLGADLRDFLPADAYKLPSISRPLRTY